MNNEMIVETEWKDCNTNPPKNNIYKLLVHYIEDCFDESNYTIDLFDYINGDWFFHESGDIVYKEYEKYLLKWCDTNNLLKELVDKN